MKSWRDKDYTWPYHLKFRELLEEYMAKHGIASLPEMAEILGDNPVSFRNQIHLESWCPGDDRIKQWAKVLGVKPEDLGYGEPRRSWRKRKEDIHHPAIETQAAVSPLPALVPHSSMELLAGLLVHDATPSELRDMALMLEMVKNTILSRRQAV